VEPGYRGRDSALVFCEYALEVLNILWFCGSGNHVTWQWCFAKGVKSFLEFLVWSVVEEAECSSSAGGVVDDFCHHGLVFSEVEFVSDSDFACGFDEYVPESELGVEFSQEEYFDFGSCLLLVAFEACGEDLGVVEDEDILVVEVIEDVVEVVAVLDDSAGGVEYHEATFIAEGCGVLCDAVVWELEFELGKFHVFSDLLILFFGMGRGVSEGEALNVVWELDGLLVEPLWEGVHGEAGVCGDVAHAGASEGCQVGSTAECLSDVAGEGSDIGAF
jgi:hypothetical protein